MTRILPAHSGLFTVTICVPDEDREWCDETKASFDAYMLEMIEGGAGAAIGALPATSVQAVGSRHELVLRWEHQPADGPWAAAESIIETAKVAFPDLLTVTDDLSVEVERETRLGYDVEVSDDEAAMAELLAENLVDPDSVPSTWQCDTTESGGRRGTATLLEGGLDRAYVVELGVLDLRSRHAYSQGQCHALAIALHDETDWPLVMIRGASGAIDHVCVRAPDGKLVDIRGAHDPVELASGGTIEEVDLERVEQLAESDGYAAPQRYEAASFVDSVLDHVVAGLPPAEPAPTWRKWLSSPDHELAVEFDGEPCLTVWCREIGSGAWSFYGYVNFPKDPSTGRRVVEYTDIAFDDHLSTFSRSIDERRLLEQIAAGAMPGIGCAVDRGAPPG